MLGCIYFGWCAVLLKRHSSVVGGAFFYSSDTPVYYTLLSVGDCTSLKIDRGSEPNSRQNETQGEVPNPTGKAILLVP